VAGIFTRECLWKTGERCRRTGEYAGVTGDLAGDTGYLASDTGVFAWMTRASSPFTVKTEASLFSYSLFTSDFPACRLTFPRSWPHLWRLLQ
jgi:hypothetical protein